MKILSAAFLITLCLTAFLAHAAHVQKIRFCRFPSPGVDVAYIAEDKGYFKDEGLDVVTQTVTNGKICQDALLAGQADFSIIGDGPLAYLGFSEQPLRFLAQVGINPETSLFTRKDRGIADAKDIKGKAIGYLPGTASYIYLAHLLDKAKLGIADIKPVPLQPPAMPQALVGGLIDAFVFWEPWGNMAMVQLGDNGVRLHYPSLYNVSAVLVAPDSVIKADPEEVKKVLKVFMRAEEFLKKNPAEARKLLSRDLNLDERVLQQDWAEFDFTIKLNAGLVDILTQDARYIRRDDPNFKDKPLPDFRKYIDARFLKAVAPERVEKGM
jgi:ABC-type nitrate/sulfonate/bicarbonate transport system substrate-binding protein